ncbi:MerR family transcriptional regulator [Cryptosporangium aurantiacum]|uniref:DNA-binding transcriptional regulator, MerR family n=1 Tax=Cryptosporangium aurantiacum TaxID=134849 RepID=A0A1M7QTS1_9ACTN|nr:MerR family transcriptional regulator [Cryptosporangium aurantiacum]SHN35020.1 DNA-binding transcriptional regulator, MerR family [Cryptosporangium aurantiacum]
MNEGTEIGQLSRRTGLPVHTIRFWSECGLVPATERTAGGYRLFDAAAAERLDLVQMLRELGIGLDDVRDVLARQVSVADVAAVQVRALDAEIRALRLRRALLRVIAEQGATTEETLLMQRLTRLSANERQRIIDEFVDGTFAGVDLGDDAKVVVDWMRELPDELQDDPTAAQVAAWVELAELVADDDFRQRIKRIAASGSAVSWIEGYESRSVILTVANRALAEGTAPASADGQALLERIIDPDLPSARQQELRRWLEVVADARVER